MIVLKNLLHQLTSICKLFVISFTICKQENNLKIIEITIIRLIENNQDKSEGD